MIAAVIVAGGSGSRMGADIRKQYLRLDEKPILAHTLMALDRCPAMDILVLVVPAEDLEWCDSQIVIPLDLQHEIRLVAGGARRQASVANGLAALTQKSGVVMIHDGVRPFVRQRLINDLLEGVKVTGACIPAIPATDTLKQVDSHGMVVRTLDRRPIQMAQTPQAFSLELIRIAHRMAEKKGFAATDDASVVEFVGQRVKVVAGDRDNIKITTPQDMALAKTILTSWHANDSDRPGD